MILLRCRVNKLSMITNNINQMSNQKIFKSILFIGFILLISHNIHSQISMGGTPPSFSNNLKDSVQIIKMPVINVDSLLAVDSLESKENKPFRFGYAIDVDMGLQNIGTWDTLQNGDKIWRLKISSPGAFSINLIFDDFWLPEGGEFFIYNEDKSMIIGAFTGTINNNQFNKFSTDLVKGETTVLEYYEPGYASGGKINVDKVIHAYINTFSGFGQSGDCNIDVNCPQGDDWCVEKRAVSMVLLNDNTRRCSGCLINNVRQDLTPYYLTAFHCADIDFDGILSLPEIYDAQTWLFRFKYWSPTCNQDDDAITQLTFSGANIRASGTYATTEFLLLELTTTPLSGFEMHYAGWDRTTSAPLSGVGIHHPSGDVMKISTFNQSAISIFPNWWSIQFSQGVVEHGSSGSPLFNQNHLIVGQLFGSSGISCKNPSIVADYPRFDLSWNNGLSGFLDPDNTGATSVGPTSTIVYLINKTLTGPNNFAAVGEIHIEGNVPISGWFPFCPPSNTPFTTEPGSNVEVKSRYINIYPGTEFKTGSTVIITATNNINCSDNLVRGDIVDFGCIADVTKMLDGGQHHNDYTNNENSSKPQREKEPNNVNISDNYTIYPNPSSQNINIKSEFQMDGLYIYDQTGKLIYTFLNINSMFYTFDISLLAKGLYIIEIHKINNIIRSKFIVQ